MEMSVAWNGRANSTAARKVNRKPLEPGKRQTLLNSIMQSLCGKALITSQRVRGILTVFQDKFPPDLVRAVIDRHMDVYGDIDTYEVRAALNSIGTRGKNPTELKEQPFDMLFGNQDLQVQRGEKQSAQALSERLIRKAAELHVRGDAAQYLQADEVVLVDSFSAVVGRLKTMGWVLKWLEKNFDSQHGLQGGSSQRVGEANSFLIRNGKGGNNRHFLWVAAIMARYLRAAQLYDPGFTFKGLNLNSERAIKIIINFAITGELQLEAWQDPSINVKDLPSGKEFASEDSQDGFSAPAVSAKKVIIEPPLPQGLLPSDSGRVASAPRQISLAPY